MNVENTWDGIVDCDSTEGPRCKITNSEVSKAIEVMKIRKAAGLTGVVSEMFKASGNHGVEWMTDLVNEIQQKDVSLQTGKIAFWCLCSKAKAILSLAPHTEQ